MYVPVSTNGRNQGYTATSNACNILLYPIAAIGAFDSLIDGSVVL